MAKNDDGGPAFPQELVTGFDARGGAAGISVKSEWIRGMSLRDYFAARALPVVLKQADTQNQLAFYDWADKCASACYAIADAMLAERSK